MNKNFKFAVVAGLVVLMGALAILGGSQLYAATQKKPSVVGFVDTQAVFFVAPQTKTAEDTLNKEIAALQTQMEKEIKNLSQDQREKVQAKYEQKVEQRRQELISGVLKNIDTIIRQVADEVGVQVVLDKQAVIYGGQDLTEQVKQRVLKPATTKK